VEKCQRTNHWTRIAAVTLLILTVLVAALPYQAQAASCMKYYTVKKGDKKGTIASEYDVKWIEIAQANNLADNYQLGVGDVLCIPFPYSVTLKNNLTVRSINNLVRVTASDLQNKGSYTVRVRDITNGPGDWYKLGKMKVSKDKTATADFILPKELRSSIYLQVCVKNVTTDKAVCKPVRHGFSQPQ
jgi:hypothetical protein